LSLEDLKESPSRKTDRIVIEIMSGPEDGRKIACDKTPITIGRSGENSIALPSDQLVSRRHARISGSQDGFSLEDLESANGTFIGKERVRKNSAPVKPDELFRIGATLLRIKPHRAKVSST
jgi:pSer/pThr/pTyr-binding forkhead associated (FHA) protein